MQTALRRTSNRICSSKLHSEPFKILGIRAISNRTNAGGTEEPVKYCQDLVRKHDYEGFLTCFAYPAHLRNGYFAVKAFNTELAMIPESTSQAMIGQMRLQFWRDAVKSTYEGKPPQHPIALALQSVTHLIPAYHLLRIVDARIAETTNPGFMTTTSLTEHAESTHSTLLYSLLSLLSLSHSSVYSHAASHLGTASALAILLRALPHHAQKRQLYLPAEVTAKHGVSQEEVFRVGGDANGIADAVYEVASLAEEHVRTARGMFEGKVPEEAMPVFLSAIPTISYLGRLEVFNFNAFEPKLQLREWKLPYLLWKANRSRSF